MNQNPISTPSKQLKLGSTHPNAQISSAGLSEARSRMPLNIISNLVWLGLNMAVRLWFVPYSIGHLGVAIYGLVPLISSVTDYMTIFTHGFNSATGRFLTIDLAKNEVEAANHTFNTSVVISLIIVACLTPIALAFSWFAPQIFEIPAGQARNTQWLVLFTAAGFMAITIASSFAVSSYAFHRFDLRLLVNVIRLMAQVAITVILFNLLSPQVWQIGVGIFLSSFFFLAGHGMLWRKLTPQLTIKFNFFNHSRLREMLGFSSWILVDQMGALLFLSIDLVIANLIFGPEIAGRYGALITFPTLLRTLAATVNGVLIPIVVTLYAQNRFSAMIRLSHLSVKMMGLVMALPIGLLCGLSQPFLTTWLGPEFANMSWLLILLTAHLSIVLAVLPLSSLQDATNKVRVPGIVSLLTGIANALLAIALAWWSGWGYLGIAAAGTIMLTVKNGIFVPIYGARILKLPWWTFLPDAIPGGLACLGVGLVGYFISLHWDLTGWIILALVALVISSIYGGVIFLVGLTAEERVLLKSEISYRLNRVKK